MARILSCLLAMLVVAAPAAQGATIVYEAVLSGPAESPPNNSPGTGEATVTYDTVTNDLTITSSWSGLLSVTTVAHIHCCTSVPFGAAGVAVTPTTLPGFPAGVTAGTYGPVVVDLDLSTSFTSAFVTASGGTLAGAAAALIAGMNSTDRAYFNIHTSAFPGGEIRGFLAPIPVPAAVWLLASALGVLAWARGRITS